LQSFDSDIEHSKGKGNYVAVGFSRLCTDNMSELKPRKDRQETYESFKGGEGKVEVNPENLISLMVILNFTDSPSIPKLFLMLMREQLKHFELWVRPVIEYETMSDQEMPRHRHSVHKGLLVNGTLSSVIFSLDKELSLSRG